MRGGAALFLSDISDSARCTWIYGATFRAIGGTSGSAQRRRSTGPAVFVGGWALSQLWLFWLAPLIGGALGGLAYRGLFEARRASI